MYHFNNYVFFSITGLFKVKLHVLSLNRELTQIKREINLVQKAT
ncbi:hypothetical protein [Wolbachia endosymbiont of Cylisticus convexus]|nr:hypothetical protein [Wolbachia endosymbiont of Cylisticus convexus]